MSASGPRSAGDQPGDTTHFGYREVPTGDKQKLVGEVADLWFHSMIALAHYGLKPADVIAELERREGTSGIEEKALRKAVARSTEEGAP